jgi:2-keto-4-pentenoate hydratase/2-oxohepta-3-ene-1,7-dioic acid hydratase in catechol pathway
LKLARFECDGKAGLGLCRDDGVVDLARHIPSLPGSMIELMTQWDDWADAVRAQADRPCDHEYAAVRLLAPVDRPGKVMIQGLNYADHAAEAGMTLPSEQMWIAKAVTSINDPYGDVEVPRVSEQLDYEVELVIVIGRRAKHLSREEAKSAIFGYCVGNDFSIRDWQFKTGQFLMGKSFDTTAPIGPWIVTADAVDPHRLPIRCLVNGEQRQSSNTSHFIFDCYDMVSYLSQAVTLEPGDVIFTGTPDGVGAVRTPPAWLKPGDVVRSEIDGIGHIENRIVAEPAA